MFLKFILFNHKYFIELPLQVKSFLRKKHVRTLVPAELTYQWRTQTRSQLIVSQLVHSAREIKKKRNRVKELV